MLNKGVFSSYSEHWETPRWLFNKLHREFSFTVDVCASAENATCPRFYTKADDGLSQDWQGVCWMNPPYGRVIGQWMRKAFLSAVQGATVVCLVPSRTDTGWWHNYAMQASEIRFIKGRLKFINRMLPSYREDGQMKVSSAPFPSAVVIFTPVAEPVRFSVIEKPSLDVELSPQQELFAA